MVVAARRCSYRNQLRAFTGPEFPFWLDEASEIMIPIVGAIAILIGYSVGKMPCWKSWQGYVGLMIVAPLAIGAGITPVEVVVDCAALGAGFALARRPRH